MNVATRLGVTFEVIGHPKPQGSKRAFVVGGKARMTESAGAGGYAWRDSVSAKALEVASSPFCPTFDGPIVVEIEFRFPVARTRTKACERAGGTIPKTTSPDVDKLVRSVLDGLTASGLIVDDRLVVELTASKAEVLGWTGARIAVRKWEQ